MFRTTEQGDGWNVQVLFSSRLAPAPGDVGSSPVMFAVRWWALAGSWGDRKKPKEDAR